MKDNIIVTKNSTIRIGVKLKSNLPYLQGKTYMVAEDTLHILEYADYNNKLQGVYVNEDNEDNNFMGKKTYTLILDSLYEM